MLRTLESVLRRVELVVAALDAPLFTVVSVFAALDEVDRCILAF